MLMQIRSDWVPHRVEDEVNAFSPCQLGGRNEIGIPSHQYNLVSLPLIGDGSDIETDPHVRSFLSDVVFEIVIGQVFEFPLLL